MSHLLSARPANGAGKAGYSYRTQNRLQHANALPSTLAHRCDAHNISHRLERNFQKLIAHENDETGRGINRLSHDSPERRITFHSTTNHSTKGGRRARARSRARARGRGEAGWRWRAGVSRVRTVTVYACVCGTTAAGGAMHAEREREAEREKSEIERSQPEKRREKRKEKRESYERTNERTKTHITRWRRAQQDLGDDGGRRNSMCGFYARHGVGGTGERGKRRLV